MRVMRDFNELPEQKTKKKKKKYPDQDPAVFELI